MTTYEEYEVIYLEPVDPSWDDVQSMDGRTWCSDGDVWDAPGVKFIRADLAQMTTAERALIDATMTYAGAHVAYGAAGFINSAKQDDAWLKMMQACAAVDAERAPPRASDGPGEHCTVTPPLGENRAATRRME